MSIPLGCEDTDMCKECHNDKRPPGLESRNKRFNKAILDANMEQIRDIVNNRYRYNEEGLREAVEQILLLAQEAKGILQVSAVAEEDNKK